MWIDAAERALQSLIDRKLFMRNGDVKILTAQETWDLVTNLVEVALSPPCNDEEEDGNKGSTKRSRSGN
jgi:hypothetical protein